MHPSTTPSVYDLTFEDIEQLTDPRTAATVFQDLYRRRLRRGPGIQQVLDAAGIGTTAPLTFQRREDGSTASKFVFGLPGGGAIEAVRIRRRTGMTACVSSQVGCAFGCRFCASGKLGLQRHLRAGEIVQQVLELGRRVNRLVFMGIGEPLHNYEQVLRSIRILRDRRGLGLQTSGVTISTIGIPKRLRQLREEHLKINLTVSLHATTDELRHRLIPGARPFALSQVIRESDRWAERHHRPVTYGYLLLPGHNDAGADAARLIALLPRGRARVNLMRWNPIIGGDEFRRVDDRRLTSFKRRLERAGLSTVVRDTQGRDVEGACGQLWLRDVEAKPRVPAGR